MEDQTATGTAPMSDTLGRGSLAVAVATVQFAVFAGLVVLDMPTLYVPFALASAATLGYVSDRGWFGLATATLGTVLLLALALPLGLFVARQKPALVAQALTDPAVHQMLYLTIYAPLVAAVLALLFGVPLAYLLARGFPGDAVIAALVDLPLVVPHSVAGILILFGFGRRGVLPGVSVLGTMAGMVLALSFVAAPFAVNAARDAFEAVDPRLEYAARSHGATQTDTFLRVSLPLAKRGIATGGVLAWARGVSEFGAVAVVAYTVEFFYPPAFDTVLGTHAPVYIFQQYNQSGLDQSGSVAFVLLVLSLLIFLLVRWLGFGQLGGAS
ncbi:ABC transporter permease [Haloarchaeobius sp. DYHT-AS-18]|uniref:ABC transporter permease n=1 Tax=Haloarchaeobius sp. DYHT-AS-18 TaxID=3446117 RepID=UPI003EBB5EB3